MAGRLREALGPNGQLIVNLIPEMEFIIGKQPPVPTCRRRTRKTASRSFSGDSSALFARPEHPLALFLDDLQWLDAATLEFLEHLVTEPDVRHLLLVGAYRDNEVSSSHPLLQTLDAIRKAGARMQEIVLAPLGLDDVGRLVADAPALRGRCAIPWRNWCTRRRGAIHSSPSSSSWRWPKRDCLHSTRSRVHGHGNCDRIRAKRLHR